MARSLDGPLNAEVVSRHDVSVGDEIKQAVASVGKSGDVTPMLVSLSGQDMRMCALCRQQKGVNTQMQVKTDRFEKNHAVTTYIRVLKYLNHVNYTPGPKIEQPVRISLTRLRIRIFVVGVMPNRLGPFGSKIACVLLLNLIRTQVYLPRCQKQP